MTDTVWREIDGQLLAAALQDAFGVTSIAVPTQDVSVEFVGALLGHLEESDPICDHSVGICACATQRVMLDLALWVIGRRECTACGGDGIGDFVERHVTDEFGNDWEEHEPVPCIPCEGKGTVTL